MFKFLRRTTENTKHRYDYLVRLRKIAITPRGADPQLYTKLPAQSTSSAARFASWWCFPWLHFVYMDYIKPKGNAAWAISITETHNDGGMTLRDLHQCNYSVLVLITWPQTKNHTFSHISTYMRMTNMVNQAQVINSAIRNRRQTVTKPQ